MNFTSNCRSVFIAISIVCATFLAACEGHIEWGQQPDVQNELAKAFAGDCSNNLVSGQTFSYEFMGKVADNKAIPGFTREVLACLGTKAKENPAYALDGCLLIYPLLADNAEACKFDIYASVACPDGGTLDKASGVCTLPDGITKVCADSSTPRRCDKAGVCKDGTDSDPANVCKGEGGAATVTAGQGGQETNVNLYVEISAAKAVKKYTAEEGSSASAPQSEDTAPATPPSAEYCPDGSAIHEGTCPKETLFASAFSAVCPDGTAPKDGACPLAAGVAAEEIFKADGVTVCPACTLTMQAMFPKNHPGQFVDDVRKYIDVNKVRTGDIYLKFCADAACSDLKYMVGPVASITKVGTAKPFAIALSGVPQGGGIAFVQTFLHTEYNTWYSGQSACTKENCPAPFDFVQMKLPDGVAPKDAALSMNNNADAALNPAPAASPVTIAASGETKVDGIAALGHLVLDRSFQIPPPAEEGMVLVASTNGPFRNAIRALNLNDYTVKTSPIVLNDADGKEARVDICTLIPGKEGEIYAVGVYYPETDTRWCGDFVYRLTKTDAGSYAQDPKFEVFIPTRGLAAAQGMETDLQGCKGSKGSYSFDTAPKLCRGAFAQDAKGNGFLYLTEFQGAGAKDGGSYPVVGIDLSAKKVVQPTVSNDHVVSTLALDKDLGLRALRGIAVGHKYVYLLQSSWSGAAKAGTNELYRLAIQDDGSLADADKGDPIVADAGVVNAAGNSSQPVKGAGTHGPAGLIGFDGADGLRYLAVGSDTEIIFYQLSEDKAPPDAVKEVGRAETSTYGIQFTDFALSPKQDKLYAISTWFAPTDASFTIPMGKNKKPTTISRQLIPVFDLAEFKGGGAPPMLFADRDFNGDGKADGGVDVLATNIKANAMKWIDQGSGIIPPVMFIGPQLAAGENALFIRGTGIQGDNKGVSGLGQGADIAGYDLASGNTIAFRDYTFWLNGPGRKEDPKGNLKACGRWGYDLDEALPELSTGGIAFVGPTTKWGGPTIDASGGGEGGKQPFQIDPNIYKCLIKKECGPLQKIDPDILKGPIRNYPMYKP